MRYKRHLMATSALLAAALGAATTAHAQSRGTSANTIEELVVTAEKREQNLQDIPVAISAFTDRTRDVIGIQSIQDMTNFTPGLQYSTSTDRVSLRGLGRLTNVLSADASVANYSDGVYETFAVRAGASTLFTDRVEVLRGPQGTLYGRNSIAGAINIISKRPTEDWFAEARVGYANYQHSNVEFAVSGPTPIPGWNFRLATQWEQQKEGWIKNTVPGKPSEGGVINNFYIEGQIEAKITDKLDMWTKFGYTYWHGGAGNAGSQSGGWSPNIYNLQGQVLPDISATNRNGGNGFDITEFYNAATHLNAGFGCSGLATNVISASGSGLAGCVNASHDSPWKINRPTDYRVRLPNAYTFGSHWTYHAPGFDVKYILGGVRYWYHLEGSTPNGSRDAPITQFTAGGNTFYPQERFDYQEKNGFLSHELNLVSTNEGPFSWIAGAYYFNQHYKQPVSTLEDPMQTQWSAVPPFGVCRSGVSPGGGVPAPAVTCVAGAGRRFDNRPDVHDKSWATYGQLSYKATDSLTFTGGLRYSHDNKYGSESVRLLCLGLPACLGGVPPEAFIAPLDLTGVNSVVAGGSGGADAIPTGVTGPTYYDPTTGFATRNYDVSWQAVTGTAKAEWQPDADTNVYASYSRGYRSGGFNIGIFTVLSFQPYSNKETVDAFELGLKKNWGRTLQTNFAIYHYAYDNLQIPISFSQTGNINGAPVSQISTTFYNVPKSRSQGFEAETTWQPIDNLQLIFNYSYIDAQVREGTAVDIADPTATQAGAQPIHTFAQCQALVAAGTQGSDCANDAPTAGLANGGFIRAQSLAGGDLPNAPRNKVAVAANYTWITSAGSLTGTVSYAWRDKTYGAIFKRWYYEAPAWDQWDARFLWRDKDDKYEIIGYVKNIFDKIGYDQGATAERLSGGFSSLYGPAPAGLTCSPVVATGTVSCVQGIRKTFYTTPPRTYGIELRYKFF
jgi:iron complex outermembrane receptor protein